MPVVSTNSTGLIYPLDVRVYATLEKVWQNILTQRKEGDGRHMTTSQLDDSFSADAANGGYAG